MLQKEVRKMTINNVIGNFLGHAGITYWIKRSLSGIESGGVQGYIGDFVVTGFLFPSILAVIFLLMYRRKMARGEFDVSEVPNRRPGNRLPDNAWLAALVIGLLGLASAALPLGLFLALAGPQPLSPMAVSMSKGIWAAIVAGIIVPVAMYHGAGTATVHQRPSTESP